MAFNSVVEWFQAGLQNAVSQQRERQLLVIATATSECLVYGQQLAVSAMATQAHIIWLGSDAPQGLQNIPPRQFRQILGKEYDVVFYNATQDFSPSTLLALEGCVRFGGKLVLLVPPFTSWPAVVGGDPRYSTYGYASQPSHFISRLIQVLEKAEPVALYTETRCRLPAPRTLEPRPQQSISLSAEQQTALNTILQSCTQATATHIISGERGRGKSTLLGKLAAELAHRGNRVVVTSLLTSATDTFFEVLKHQNLREVTRQYFISPNGGVIQWFAPDNPLLQTSENNWLLIDEAAALPLPVTERLITFSTHVVLGTTSGGYEGSANGFALKLMPRLTSAPDTTLHSLTTPFRFHVADSMTHWINTLLLRGNSRNVADTLKATDDMQTVLTSFARLSNEEALRVIALLEKAHYQTSPDDIMRLMDAPDALLFVTQHHHEILAVALIHQEGGEPLRDLAGHIASGERRVKGHLSAQSCALFLADPAVATYCYWRINRIAVHPDFRRMGLASALLGSIKQFARDDRIDALSSSFGHTDELMSFWQNNEFRLVRKGSKPNKASGSVSSLVVNAVNPIVVKMIELMSELNQMENQLTPSVPSAASPDLQTIHARRLRAFALRHRGIDLTRSSIRWINMSMGQLTASHNSPVSVYSERLSLEDVTKAFNTSGKKDSERIIREEIDNILRSSGNL